MNKIALAAAAIATLAAASTADALPLFGIGGVCPPFMCNGPRLNGLALPVVKAQQPIVNAVTLPSGEIVNLR
jgi:hypothetical protein